MRGASFFVRERSKKAIRCLPLANFAVVKVEMIWGGKKHRNRAIRTREKML